MSNMKFLPLMVQKNSIPWDKKKVEFQKFMSQWAKHDIKIKLTWDSGLIKPTNST